MHSPPLTSVTDAAILATLAEGTLFVVKAETVPRRTAQAAREQLHSVQAHILGAILNDVPVQRDGYYYQYYYQRHYNYYTSQDGSRRSEKGHFPASAGPWGILSLLKKKRKGHSRETGRKQ